MVQKFEKIEGTCRADKGTMDCNLSQLRKSKETKRIMLLLRTVYSYGLMAKLVMT